MSVVVYFSGRNQPLGSINLFNRIIQKTVALGFKISEYQIEQILSGDKPIFQNEEIYRVIEAATKEFVINLLSKIQENGLEMTLNPNIFMGGGSMLLKRYIEKESKGYMEIIEDPFANAKGFEMLTRQKISQR